MEHAREVIRGFENAVDGIWGLEGCRVRRRVQIEKFCQVRQMFVENHLGHLGCERFDSRRKGLASPYRCHGRIPSKDVFMYPRQLDIRFLGVRHDQAIHDPL